MWTTSWAGLEPGLVPYAVGGPFAVLVAEELASSGAELIISVTSAGQVLPLARPPYLVLIEKAWRDEGTSLHYQPPSEWSHLQPHLAARLPAALAGLGGTVFTGASWTTDAPFRETPSAIAAARSVGVHAVVMEAASLYAYAAARSRDVICLPTSPTPRPPTETTSKKASTPALTGILSVVTALARAVSGAPDST